MSLSKKFADLRRQLRQIDQQLNRNGQDLRALQHGSVAPRRNRWNAIGRTRRRLAEILTTYIRAIEGSGGGRRYPEASVAPEDIRPMRLAGKARIYEDAHSWEAYARWPNGTVCKSLMSYDTMTAVVRAGRVHPIGEDGEVGVQ